jgi:hypothetical protein
MNTPTAIELTMQAAENVMFATAVAGAALAAISLRTATRLAREQEQHTATRTEFARYRAGVIVIALPSDEFNDGEGI